MPLLLSQCSKSGSSECKSTLVHISICAFACVCGFWKFQSRWEWLPCMAGSGINIGDRLLSRLSSIRLTTLKLDRRPGRSSSAYSWCAQSFTHNHPICMSRIITVHHMDSSTTTCCGHYIQSRTSHPKWLDIDLLPQPLVQENLECDIAGYAASLRLNVWTTRSTRSAVIFLWLRH